MKTKTINPGWYSFMLILLAIALAILMNSCDCISDDGMLTYSYGGTASTLTIGIMLMLASLFIMGASELENIGIMFLSGFLFVVGIFCVLISVRNMSFVAAVDNPMYEKQYIYKAVNDTVYYVVDSVYIKLR